MSAPTRFRIRSAIALACLLGGCAGTETGNPPSKLTSSITLSAISSAPETAALGQAQGGLLVEQALANVGSVGLLPCAGGEALSVVQARTFDLATPSAPEALSADGALCGVRLELTPASSASNGLPEAASLFLRGTRTDGTPFEVVSTRALSLQLNATNPSGFGELPLLLGFDVGVWFSSVDVHGAHAGADGVARLDATLNPDLLVAFDARAPLAVALYADANADGIVNASESQPIATSP